MTLKEWTARYSVTLVSAPRGFRVRVFTDGLSYDAKWELWHLSDYFVEACISGPAVSLAERAA